MKPRRKTTAPAVRWQALRWVAALTLAPALASGQTPTQADTAAAVWLALAGTLGLLAVVSLRAQRLRLRLSALLAERGPGVGAAAWATQVIDAVKVIILVVGNDGRVRYVNAFGESLLGYRREELIGRDWFELVLRHEHDGRTRAVFEASVAAGTPPGDYEHDIITKSGEQKCIEWRNTKFPAADGDWQWLCVGKDVTALRAAERALAEQHAELERLVGLRTAELEQSTAMLRATNAAQNAIFETVPAGIVMTRGRRIERCNGAMEKLLGWAPGELVGQSCREFYADDETFTGIQERFEAAMRETGLWREELELVRRDGSRFHGRFFGRYIDFGRPALGEVVLLDDISAEHAARCELERARAAAEAATQAKSDFLANMSHELRTPLNALLGFAGLLLRQAEPDSRQRAYLEKMNGAGQYLSRLVSDILDYSRAEAGRLRLEHVDFRLSRVLQGAAQMVADAARAKGLELVIDVEPGVPSLVNGDPTRLGQVLVNLLGNAVKFSDLGTVVLRVGLLGRDAQTAVLRFEVRDQGIGLSAEDQLRVFERFTQVDASLTRSHGGAGLGLAIVRELARLMGGEVGVDSAPGEGARFWFSAEFRYREQDPMTRELPADLQRTRVLAAVANAETRAAIGNMLESMRFEVQAADSLAACLHELAAADAAGAPYALCYFDATLTGEHGLADRVDALALTRRPRLVALTDAAGPPAAELADQVLSKPVTPSSLFNAAMNALRGDEGVNVHRLPLATPRQADFEGRRVLLVEDNEANRDLMINLLAEYGLWTDLAENGVVALRRLMTESYDLVFMDLQMPVMGGLEATRTLRGLPGVAQPPIIALTAQAMAGDAERCLEAGMNDYMPKPVSAQTLDERLHLWLRPAEAAPSHGVGA
jgi:two-component system sensor histidine kinase/response regulator